MSHMELVRNGIRIRRLKKKRNIQNEARIKGSIQRFDSDAYTRMQFCLAVSHSLGAHTDAFQFAPYATDDDDDDDDDDIDATPAEPAHDSSSATSTSATDEDVSTSTQPSVTNLVLTNAGELCDVCLIDPRSGVTASLRCRAATRGSAETVLTLVSAMDSGCPLCRTPISMVLRVLN